MGKIRRPSHGLSQARCGRSLAQELLAFAGVRFLDGANDVSTAHQNMTPQAPPDLATPDRGPQ
jgi:hypothetical protein